MPEFPLQMSTKRTIMRRISIDDARGWKAFNNRIAQRMAQDGLSWPPVPSVVYARNEILHYLQMWSAGERYVYSITDRGSGAVIGDFHLKSVDRERKRIEFGHALDPCTWGTGITYETLDAVKGMLKRRGYTPWCKVEEGNVRSWKSLEKYKAKFKGTKPTTVNGRRMVMRMYEL